MNYFFGGLRLENFSRLSHTIKPISMAIPNTGKIETLDGRSGKCPINANVVMKAKIMTMKGFRMVIIYKYRVIGL